MNTDNKPTLKGEIKKARASNYNFTRSINEFIDNSLDTDASIIFIELINHNNKPCSIKISDNSTLGIPYNNLSKLFSWTYERDRKESDIGKFGTGFKAASVNIGDKLTVYTYDKNNDKYLKCVADWNIMSENDNWVPEQINTTKDDYKSNSIHPYDYGTSFIIERILHERHPQFKIDNIYEIAYIYKYILNNNSNLQINIKLEKEIFNLKDYIYCNFNKYNNPNLIFTNNIEIYQINDPNINDNIIAVINDMKSKKPYYVKCKDTHKNGNHSVDEKTYYHHKNNNLLGYITFKSCFDGFGNRDIPNFVKLPYGSVDVVRSKRIVGINITNYSAPRNDGYANYIKHEISYDSSLLDDYLGISFNKSNDGNIPDNNIKYVINHLIKKHQNNIIKIIEQEQPKPLKPELPNPKQPKPELPKPDPPNPEQPKPEPPKPELPKPEQPKPEPPKPEQPKPEQPKPEPPKPELPKPEQPKPEPPKPEQPKPEQPKPEPPKPEQPKPEQPKPEQPKPEPPKPEQPKPEQPKPEQPKPEPSKHESHNQEQHKQKIVELTNISNIICENINHHINNTYNIYDNETKRNIYLLIIDNLNKCSM